MQFSKTIWAITCYFNPIGYKRRLANYHVFRDMLRIPLVTVELSHNGHYDLGQEDADILVQLKCEDLLWQKERLLNIGLQSLPSACDTVAWLDCDVIFENEDWAERATDLLERFKIVSPLTTLYELPKDKLPGDAEAKQMPGYSLMYALDRGIAPPDILRGKMRLNARISTGGAGVARREFLGRHGFYDACVMGGGNRAFACAALGRFDDAIHYLQMSPTWAKHYLSWAKPFFNDVRGSLTYLNGGVFHLWHGNLEHRQYSERHEFLRDLDFDPTTDIVDEGGCWRWKRDRADVSQCILRYLQSRREDG